MIKHIESREEWLKERIHGIGGSQAAAVIGVSPWITNVQLWEQKKGITKAADISENKSVIFGTKAEKHLRELFTLRYTDFNVDYAPYDLHINDEYPFIFATLDGVLTDLETHKQGILEIKTANISHKNLWTNEEIPQHYYTQILHQFIATGFEFAFVFALLYKDYTTDMQIKTYRFERAKCVDDMEYLKDKEIEFWASIESGIEPPLILPGI